MSLRMPDWLNVNTRTSTTATVWPSPRLAPRTLPPGRLPVPPHPPTHPRPLPRPAPLTKSRGDASSSKPPAHMPCPSPAGGLVPSCDPDRPCGDSPAPEPTWTSGRHAAAPRIQGGYLGCLSARLWGLCTGVFVCACVGVCRCVCVGVCVGSCVRVRVACAVLRPSAGCCPCPCAAVGLVWGAEADFVLRLTRVVVVCPCVRLGSVLPPVPVPFVLAVSALRVCSI